MRYKILKFCNIYCKGYSDNTYIIICIFLFQAHVASCSFMIVKCRNEGCEVSVATGDLNRHMKDECLYKKIKCPLCKKPIIVKDKEVRIVKLARQYFLSRKKVIMAICIHVCHHHTSTLLCEEFKFFY